MKHVYVPLFLLLFAGCKTTEPDRGAAASAAIPVREHSVQAVLWQQTAAEYEALCYQAFALARLRLDERLAEPDGTRPLAIVTDVDETLIDNSPYNANMIQTDQEYSRAGWTEWGRLRRAEAIPGAVEFLQYAAGRGVAVFYVSNRYADQLEDTQANLRALGFPEVTAGRVLLRTTTSGKEPRRQKVEATHDVILLLGDNLSDFAEEFEDLPAAERSRLVERRNAEFGNRFIVLPNPMYGDWETDGLYEGRYDWTGAQKDSLRRARLRGY